MLMEGLSTALFIILHPLSIQYPIADLQWTLDKSTMTKATSRMSRERRIQQAIDLVRSGSTYRQAEADTKIPRSTIRNSVRSQNTHVTQARHNRLDTLTPLEEELVVTLLIPYAERGMPLPWSSLEQSMRQTRQKS